MKFSESWVREWVDPEISSEELAEQLTMLGLEVDDYASAGGDFSDVVVGKIESVEQHPDADRLRVCQVNDGNGSVHNVVCGAPNARAGICIPFARVGAVLPGGFKIKSSKLRGVKSDGMLCSAAELKLSEEADGLHELPADAPLGMALVDYLALDDHVIDIDLTPNRGDCLSIRGVAREVSARNNVPMQEPEFDSVPQQLDDTFSVAIDQNSCCASYAGKIIRGIDANAKSPLWMVEKLRRCGLRSISPSVDVTNFVMMELGQPMHAFDMDKLEQGIHVRLARPGEKLTLLDDREVTLEEDTTVIADQKKAVAIAGIMGGNETGVTEHTKNVLLEAALFTPLGIAGKPRRYNACTDSAQRFERGVDSDLQHRAIERAAFLLTSIVGGQAGPMFEVRNDSLDRSFAEVRLRRKRLSDFLGTTVDDQRVVAILERLGIHTREVDDGWIASSPTWRYDISIEEDLIEEIARVHGYDQMPRTNPLFTPSIGSTSESDMPRYRIQQLLVDRGYQEAVCYSFVDGDKQIHFDPQSDALALANPIASDMGVMRNTLWVGLCETMQSNLNRRQSDIRLFECGLKFVMQGDDLIQKPVLAGVVAGLRNPDHWSASADSADFYDVKADVEAVLKLANGSEFRFESGNHPALHPGMCARIMVDEVAVGWLGTMHPKLQKTLDLSQLPIMFEIDMEQLEQRKIPAFTDISKFPSVRRDLSVILDQTVSYAMIRACVEKHAPESLQTVRIVSVYTGSGITDGSKSVALGLILQDFSRTLDDIEIDSAVSQILNGLTSDLRATLRT